VSAADSDPNRNPGAVSPTCTCGRPSWSQYTDLWIEVMSLREHLAQVDEDLVELIGHVRYQAYLLFGGTVRTPGSFRAETRENLRRGGTGFGEIPLGNAQ